MANVKDFTAQGDGVTDDTDSIKSAINSLSGSGGTIYFPSGTYMVRAGEIYPKTDAVTFYGDGMNVSMLKKIAAENGPIILTSVSYPVTDIVFNDLGFDGNHDNATGYNGLISLASNAGFSGTISITDCRFWRPGEESGVYLKGVTGGTTIQDCLFHSPGDGIGMGINLDTAPSDVTIDGCQFLYLDNGIEIKANASDVDIINSNVFDGGWYLLKTKFTGSGGTVSYTADELTDTAASFADMNWSPTNVYHNIRVMPTRESGTANYTATTLTDASATFESNGVIPKELVRADGVFGIIESVDSETQLTVEEWLSTTDYQTATTPSNGTSYTAYRIILGSVWDPGNPAQPYDATHITTHVWFDLEGNTLTPDDETLYEVLVERCNYAGVHVIAGANDVLIQNNTFRRSWSDQVSIFGGPNVDVLDNTIVDGEDMGITLHGPNNSARRNTVTHCGAAGIWTQGTGNVISNNVFSNSQWVNHQNTTYIADICAYGAQTDTVVKDNHCGFVSGALGYHGIVLDTVTNGTVISNITTGHNTAEFKIREKISGGRLMFL